MEIYINRLSVETEAGVSLASVLTQQGVVVDGIAVAVDNKVVPRTEWATTRLEAGAKLTVIRAVCGG